MGSRDLTHMQLLTIPINPQDPDLVDICHGRNSLVHGATVNAVPVSGRDTAVHIKSRVDGDTTSAEFIMPGLHACRCPHSILHTLFPTRALTENTASEIRVAKWSYASPGIWKLFFCLFCFVVHVDVRQTSMTLSKPCQLPSLQFYRWGNKEYGIYYMQNEC